MEILEHADHMIYVYVALAVLIFVIAPFLVIPGMYRAGRKTNAELTASKISVCMRDYHLLARHLREMSMVPDTDWLKADTQRQYDAVVRELKSYGVTMED